MQIGRWFQSKHPDGWLTLAQEIGGEMAPAEGGQPLIRVPHARGTIRIEGHVTMVMVGKVPVPMISTRLSITLPSTRAQRFSVSRASFASAVAAWFGSLDIQVDDPVFDEAFTLKGETPDVVRTIFADPALRQRYLRDFEGQLHRHDDGSVFGDPTPDADPFTLDVPNLVEDAVKLRALYDLFVATLDRLD